MRVMPDPNEPSHRSAGDSSSPTAAQQRLLGSLSNDSFNDWYHEQQYTDNILEGRPYFNGASPPPDDDKHSPSKLLQCHRKVRYYAENAPQEGDPPEGLFWVGTRFEEDIIVPYFLEAVTTDDTYVQNSMWIDETIDTDGVTVRVKGVTDPVIVDADAVPILPSEIKTTSSLEYLDGPKRHHKAQLHAYLYALNAEYNRSIRDGVVVYGARDTLDIQVYHVPFDEGFWQETVLPWMQTQTRYRSDGVLPPAEPVFDWECDTCPFQHRCGQTNSPYSDVGFTGLVPDVAAYRKQSLREYFDAYPDAKLTPTLADKYPTLAAEHGVYEWRCSNCERSYDRGSESFDGESPEGSLCPECSRADRLSSLRVPVPSKQVPDELARTK